MKLVHLTDPDGPKSPPNGVPQLLNALNGCLTQAFISLLQTNYLKFPSIHHSLADTLPKHPNPPVRHRETSQEPVPVSKSPVFPLLFLLPLLPPLFFSFVSSPNCHSFSVVCYLFLCLIFFLQYFFLILIIRRP
ncbi:hypothetical protein J3F83DRAFT_230979 [Trichoderma novae-zelandiae]